MKRDELLAAWQAMSDREKRGAVLVDVMGFTHYVGEAVPEEHRHYGEPVETLEVWLRGEGPKAERYCQHCGDMPDFLEDHAAAYAVEERIAEMGLTRQYALVLIGIVVEKRPPMDMGSYWLIAHATPAQRCCAAWVTCKVREG